MAIGTDHRTRHVEPRPAISDALGGDARPLGCDRRDRQHGSFGDTLGKALDARRRAATPRSTGSRSRPRPATSTPSTTSRSLPPRRSCSRSSPSRSATGPSRPSTTSCACRSDRWPNRSHSCTEPAVDIRCSASPRCPEGRARRCRSSRWSPAPFVLSTRRRRRTAMSRDLHRPRATRRRSGHRRADQRAASPYELADGGRTVHGALERGVRPARRAVGRGAAELQRGLLRCSTSRASPPPSSVSASTTSGRWKASWPGRCARSTASSRRPSTSRCRRSRVFVDEPDAPDRVGARAHRRHPTSVSRDQVAAMVHLVAVLVKGMAPENVTIADASRRRVVDRRQSTGVGWQVVADASDATTAVRAGDAERRCVRCSAESPAPSNVAVTVTRRPRPDRTTVDHRVVRLHRCRLGRRHRRTHDRRRPTPVPTRPRHHRRARARRCAAVDDASRPGRRE